MEDETSVWCVGGGWGGCGALKPSPTHARSYTHSWPALAWFWSVACGHGGHRSQLSACDGLIQTPPAPPKPQPSAPTLLNHLLYLSLPPALYLPPSFHSASAAGLCLVGTFERRCIEEGGAVSISTVACI